MKTSALFVVMCLAGATPLLGQRFQMSASTANSVSATCNLPGQPSQVRTASAGTPASAVGLQAFLNGPTGFSSALVDGRTYTSEVVATLTVFENLSVSGTGSAATGPNEFLMTVQSTVPSRVVLEIEWIAQLTMGMPAPVVQVDIGDDQTVDFFGLFSGQRLLVPLTIDSTPLRIRTHTQMSAPGGATQDLQSTLNVTVRADMFGSLQALPGQIPCGDTLAIYPDLEQHLVFRSYNLSGVAAYRVLVLGFSANSRLLPGHCILHPSPDIVVPLGFSGLRIDMLHPQVRGLHIFAQAVSFWAIGQPLRASRAYEIRLP